MEIGENGDAKWWNMIDNGEKLWKIVGKGRKVFPPEGV